MSIRRTIKLLKNISKVADAYSSEQNPVWREKTAELGEEIQQRLREGHMVGYDIEGNKLKSLKKTTIRRKGHSKPLVAKNKNIVNFLRSNNFFTAGTLQVKLNPIPDAQGVSDPRYMEAQNEGWYDHVPARKWYGIPKTYREGGDQYKKFSNKLARHIEKAFGEAINKG